MGGTMRLGEYDCRLTEASRAYDAYKAHSEFPFPLTFPLIKERHRHRYEFNNTYKEEFEKHGMKCTGCNPETELVEIVELPEHRWYIGVQFHPEYSSTVLRPHPLFMSFIKACSE